MNHSQQVATTIKAQIDLWPLAEVGARGFSYGDNSLIFTARPISRLVQVTVLLTPADTYTVTVERRGAEAPLVEYTDVYADTLPELIRNLPHALDTLNLKNKGKKIS